MIDRQGRIVKRTEGDDLEGKIETLLGMTIKRELGVENPILLRKADYTGEETCSVCHREQHATWELTAHASAWQTLVEHGADRDPECLKCHTVGFGKPGGFDPEKRQAELRGVQCENCHGRGGPHQSPEFAKAGFEPICLTCHDPQHSLQFSFAERLPLVSHAANRQFDEALAWPSARRCSRSAPAASGSCSSRATTWARRPARAATRRSTGCGRTLRTRTRSRRSRRRARRRTPTASAATPPASRRRRASPPAAPRSPAWAARAATVRASATSTTPRTGQGTILALTDKCDTCAITLICGKCHDDANDPGFAFEIEPKLAKIKHGFRPKPTAAK